MINFLIKLIHKYSPAAQISEQGLKARYEKVAAIKKLTMRRTWITLAIAVISVRKKKPICTIGFFLRLASQKTR
jgi:hypothetical protein